MKTQATERSVDEPRLGLVQKAIAAAEQPRETYIALSAVYGITAHLVLAWWVQAPRAIAELPLYVILILGGGPLLVELSRRLSAREFGSDLLAGISILASVLLGEYLVAAVVVLMLSGGAALEAHASRRASSVLDALAKRMPQHAHRNLESGAVRDVLLDEIAAGDTLVVFPHEICPVDGTVVRGHGKMDESYITGEPFVMSKAPGSPVVSGAVNGDSALAIVASRPAVDSRYARIMRVMEEIEQRRPRMRRIGDRIGAWYTPLAVGIAALGWLWSGDPTRFLAVVVIATPCPLLIGIPVAILGAVSLAARRAIIIRNPAVLEQIDTCRTLIFDKTGTLTHGRPVLTEILCAPGFDRKDVLRLTSSLERYSKHPLALAIVEAAEQEKIVPTTVTHISEKPGRGLLGLVEGRKVQITGRAKITDAETLSQLPESAEGLECLVMIEDRFAAALRFRDAPRRESRRFIKHLRPNHRAEKIMLVSGDRDSEVRYLAEQVGIEEVYSSKSPEEKVAIVTREVARGPTLFVGDGINDAPAMMAATVGIALGRNCDVTTEAADAVIMDGSLEKVDELIHIGRRMRVIALQSAAGGMLLSTIGMGLAAVGYLPPLAGAIAQEVIDVAAVLNAVRVAIPLKNLADF